MHHVGVALDIHQVTDFYRSIFADSTQIIASQIHQHDMLGALFFVMEHLLFETEIFGFVAPPGMCTGDRSIFEFASTHAHQHFRRRTQHMQ